MPTLAEIRKAHWSDAEWAFVRTESDRKAVLDGCRFDRKAAERVCKFMRTALRLTTGQWAGKPFELLVWQRDHIVYPLFGWKRDDGLRRFREAYIQVAKKNGKSELVSALSLLLGFADGEERSLVVCAACDRKQAGIVWDAAALMVTQSPELSANLTIMQSTKTIIRRSDDSKVVPISSDQGSNEGHNAHAIIKDELHAWPGRKLYDALRYAGGARLQPLHIEITTAGYDQTSVCFERYQYAKSILDGSYVDTRVLPVVYEADKADDWASPDTWKKANPSLGEIIKLDDMEAEQHAAARSPNLENTFRRYKLNQWTKQDTRWLSLAGWDACQRDLTIEDFAGKPCILGVDIGDRRDTTACVACFLPSDVCELPTFFGWFFIPGDDIEARERRDRANYREWAELGFLTLTPGKRFTLAPIRDHIIALSSAHEVSEVAYDPVMANELATELDRDYGLNMIEHRQGFVSMTLPAKAFEAAIIDGKLAHDGNPMLRSHVDNVSVLTDPTGNIKPTKGIPPQRVDGVVAAVMAYGRMLIAETTVGTGNLITLDW